MKKQQLNNLIKEVLLKEISYREYKRSTDATPKQKIGNAMKLIRKKINEIKKLVYYNSKLKEEMGVASGDYWKSTQKDLHEIAEQLNHLSNQLRNLSN